MPGRAGTPTNAPSPPRAPWEGGETRRGPRHTGRQAASALRALPPSVRVPGLPSEVCPPSDPSPPRVPDYLLTAPRCWGVVTPVPTPEGGAQDVGGVAGEKWASWAGESATEHLMHVLSFRREVRGAQGLRTPDVGETLENCGVQISKADGAAGGRQRGSGLQPHRAGLRPEERGFLGTTGCGAEGARRCRGRAWIRKGCSLECLTRCGVFCSPWRVGLGAREGEGGR